jgi:hypothetical protein
VANGAGIPPNLLPGKTITDAAQEAIAVDFGDAIHAAIG